MPEPCHQLLEARASSRKSATRVAKVVKVQVRYSCRSACLDPYPVEVRPPQARTLGTDENKAAPAAPLARRQRPGLCLGRPTRAARRATRYRTPSISTALPALGSYCGAVFLASHCPARGHRVQGGPPGRRTRSAAPTQDPATTHLGLAATRKTGGSRGRWFGMAGWQYFRRTTLQLVRGVELGSAATSRACTPRAPASGDWRPQEVRHGQLP
jgi:hypothetical protein